jgi:hypothetical protein
MLTMSNTLTGRTDDGRYWLFTREHRVLARAWPVARDTIREEILRMRKLDTIGCVKFFEVV